MGDERASAPLRIERHTGELSALAGDWRRLVDPAHPGAAFRSFAWISSWWKKASPGGEQHVLVARDGAEIVGLLPLYCEPTLGGPQLRLMGDGAVGSDYLGVVARAADQARVAVACAHHLDGAGELLLDGLAEDDPLLPPLAAGALIEPRYRCPFVRTADSFDAYLATLPDGTGAQWLRRRRWLEKRPGYRVDVLAAPDEPDGIVRGIEILFELHRKRWALEGGSDAIYGPRTEAFHRTAARRLAAEGWAQVFVLSVEGAPRAALYGFRHGDRFAFYQSGHEPAWRPRSVGTVLLGEVIRRSFADGLREFDFLRGAEPYKFRWATGWRETVCLRVPGRGLRPWLAERGRGAWAELRRAGRRSLPAPAVEWLRRARKRVRALADVERVRG
jgi:CelD/BcsL family acetyltransferase involved in cellulose biosynthesis